MRGKAHAVEVRFGGTAVSTANSVPDETDERDEKASLFLAALHKENLQQAHLAPEPLVRSSDRHRVPSSIDLCLGAG